MRALLAPALLLLLLLLPPSPARGQEEKVDYLVLVPAALRDAVEPLVRHRAAEGLRVRVDVVEQLRWDGGSRRIGSLLHHVQALRPRFLLLAGDVDTLPAFEVAQAATDRPYGDLDDDGLPDVAVGRLPASDAAALSRMVQRTIAYETTLTAGAWQRQCAFVGGEARFGAEVDAVFEDMIRRIVSERVPLRFDVDMTYANPRSPYGYPAERFADRVVDRLNAGALILAYVGHGQVDHLDRLRVPGPDGKEALLPVLDVSHAPRLASGGPPIMVVLACLTGRYEGRKPCIGEALLATGQGPVAFLGATRESHPIPNALLGIQLLAELLRDDAPTEAHGDRLGPRIDRARRSLAVESDDPLRQQVLFLAAPFVPPEELQRELPRHVDMYNLLGDPALRVAAPAALTLEATASADAVEVRGLAAPGARVTVTLEAPRDRFARPAPAAGETLLERHARANERVLLRVETVADDDGAFEARLERSDSRPGSYVVKALSLGGEVRAGVTKVMLPERRRFH